MLAFQKFIVRKFENLLKRSFAFEELFLERSRKLQMKISLSLRECSENNFLNLHECLGKLPNVLKINF